MRNRIIDGRQIAAFAALVRHRRFKLAAEELFLTQSAVSHAIKSLEEDLGSRLFNRTGRKVVLTRAGERFQEHAEKILGEMRAARLELEQLSAEHHRQLCFGASTLTAHYILPPVLQEFKKKYPKCRVRLESGTMPELLEQVRAHKIDFAIGLDWTHTDDLVFQRLFEDELLFYVAGQHPWAHLRRIPRNVISEETFVVPLKEGGTSGILSRFFRSEKIAAVNSTAPGSLEAAKQLVAAGFGVGVFARWQVRAEAASGILIAVPLTTKRIVREWIVARPKGRESLPIEEEFIRRCAEAFQALSAEI
jgi:DNA-binding transcriptional LysR family regulator